MSTISRYSSNANDELVLSHSAHASIALPVAVDSKVADTLQRMFRDPRVLEPHERGDLIAQLRQAVALSPAVPEIRVLLGMALCVDLQAQEAMEELREAVTQSPECFIARLKFGELLMRLRICDQAAEHTHRAAQLASNAAQAELARRQATTIRTMQREGIERGAYTGLLSRLKNSRRKSGRQQSLTALAGTK